MSKSRAYLKLGRASLGLAPLIVREKSLRTIASLRELASSVSSGRNRTLAPRWKRLDRGYVNETGAKLCRVAPAEFSHQ
jgi:hypothetical protein